MNRRDIKTKNRIAIADTDADEELKPLQRGFQESDSNGLNKNLFGRQFSSWLFLKSVHTKK